MGSWKNIPPEQAEKFENPFYNADAILIFEDGLLIGEAELPEYESTKEIRHFTWNGENVLKGQPPNLGKPCFRQRRWHWKASQK